MWLWFMPRAQPGGGPRGPGLPQSKCCFRFLRWILAEIYLKCIILVTNFQKSPSAGGSSPSAPAKTSTLATWSFVIGQIMVFQADYDKIELQKIVTTSFQWRHHHYATIKRHQNNATKFSNLGPSNQNFWLRQWFMP